MRLVFRSRWGELSRPQMERESSGIDARVILPCAFGNESAASRASIILIGKEW